MDRVTREKLEKIQALIEGAKSQGEAEAAAAAFQRLVLRHNLSAEDLNKLGQTEREPYGTIYVTVAKSGETGVTWKVYLLWSLANLHFVAAIRQGNHGATFQLIGQETNIEALRALFDTLVTVGERLAVEGYEAYVAETQKAYSQYSLRDLKTLKLIVSKVLWTNSFKLGFQKGIYTKLKNERTQEVKADENVSALVVVKDAELAQATEQLAGKTRNQKAKIRIHGDAHRAGYRAGMEHETSARLAEPIRELKG